MAKLKKETRGGARAGSGRKAPATKKKMLFSISIEVEERLRQEVNKSGVVEKALRLYYNISE